MRHGLERACAEQDRIDAAVRDKAAAVLEQLGLTVSDAVRILLTRTANEGALPFSIGGGPDEYDAWFRAKVLEALNDSRPAVPHDQVEARFAARRTATQRKAGEAGE